jgi:hypothetical protein
MMFQGAKNHGAEYFKALESAGATDLNYATNNYRTNYFQNAPSHSPVCKNPPPAETTCLEKMIAMILWRAYTPPVPR